MPSLNEFVGPKPEKIHKAELEKIGGTKPCSKCELDTEEVFWDPINLIMSWTCESGHTNTFRIN